MCWTARNTGVAYFVSYCCLFAGSLPTLPAWRIGAPVLTSVSPTSVNQSTVRVWLPRLRSDERSQYPQFEVQYRRHGSSDWAEGSRISSGSRSVDLDEMFSDGLYEVRVRGVSDDGSQRTPYTPAATFYTRGRGECWFCTPITATLYSSTSTCTVHPIDLRHFCSVLGGLFQLVAIDYFCVGF